MIRYFCDVCDREMPMNYPSVSTQVKLKDGRMATIYLEVGTDDVGICDRCLWEAMKAKVEGSE